MICPGTLAVVAAGEHANLGLELRFEPYGRGNTYLVPGSVVLVVSVLSVERNGVPTTWAFVLAHGPAAGWTFVPWLEPVLHP